MGIYKHGITPSSIKAEKRLVGSKRKIYKKIGGHKVEIAYWTAAQLAKKNLAPNKSGWYWHVIDDGIPLASATVEVITPCGRSTTQDAAIKRARDWLVGPRDYRLGNLMHVVHS